MVDRKLEENISQFCGVTGASYVLLMVQISITRLTDSPSSPTLRPHFKPDSRCYSVKDARKFLEKYKRVDIAMDAYYNDPNALAVTAKQQTNVPSTSKLTALFEKYKGAHAHTTYPSHPV